MEFFLTADDCSRSCSVNCWVCWVVKEYTSARVYKKGGKQAVLQMRYNQKLTCKHGDFRTAEYPESDHDSAVTDHQITHGIRVFSGNIHFVYEWGSNAQCNVIILKGMRIIFHVHVNMSICSCYYLLEKKIMHTNASVDTHSESNMYVCMYVCMCIRGGSLSWET